MDSDRPPPSHRSITTSTPLFFCFTSSSSMKISSRSILSPGRAVSARDPPPISLSTSVSRRLRNSRSIKGGASPAMFPVTGKKRGFDNPEPSSPKVTCIGQVRVKSKKKHAKNLRNLSRRRNGDVSFRKLEHSRSQRQQLECIQGQRNNNQRWVHLPLTICESLKAFGSEVSCLFPCKSSCSSTTGVEKEEKMDVGSVEEGNRQGAYGAMSERWRVALQDGDGGGRDACGGGGRREIELVAGDDDEEMEVRTRRHVFENLEIVNGNILGSKDEARVSVCVPPKNALLLMRCRSDPMMMEALTNRYWEPSEGIHEVKEEDEESAYNEDKIEENIIPQEVLEMQEDEKDMALDEVKDQEHDDLQEHEVNQEIVKMDSEMEMKQTAQEEILEMEMKQTAQEETLEMEMKQTAQEETLEMEMKQTAQEEKLEMKQTTQEEKLEMEMKQTAQEEKPEMEVKLSTQEEENHEQSIEAIEEKEEEESMFLSFLFEENAYQNKEFEIDEEDDAQLDMEDAQESFEDEECQETETGESNVEKIQLCEEENEESVTEFAKRSENPDETHEEIEVENIVLERENEERETISKELPECLLLMMYEPKLSMEVSKETWVCSSDFIRRHSGKKKPPHPPPPPPPPLPPPFESMEGLDESKINNSVKEHDNYAMRMARVQYQPVSQQPARSSCSFSTLTSMAAMLEQKLVNTMGFEPLVLTRCKSEPVRTATTKLAPETCFWENKLEPPRRASFGIGVEGLGF